MDDVWLCFRCPAMSSRSKILGGVLRQGLLGEGKTEQISKMYAVLDFLKNVVTNKIC